MRERRVSPHFNEMRERPIRVRPLKPDEALRQRIATNIIDDVLELMDVYGIEYQMHLDYVLLGQLVKNNNHLTIEMLNEFLGYKIDGQVGKIVIDHVNNGLMDAHSYVNLEWSVMV